MNSNQTKRCVATPHFCLLFCLHDLRWRRDGFLIVSRPSQPAALRFPLSIATFGLPNSGSVISYIKATLDKHRIAGPQAAIDTAARVVKAHPELRSNTLRVLQMLALSLETFEARLSAVEAGSAAIPDETNEDRARCPPPTAAEESMSTRAAAYQHQITGLPSGTVIVVGGVKFDGCRALDGTLLEAKWPGYGQFLVSDIEKKSWFGGDGNIMDRARRQARAATLENRKIEWLFAEKLASQYYD
jgi:hypothetical protein